MPDEGTITFCGKQFRVVDTSANVMDALGYPLWMRFAKAARTDVDLYSIEGASLVHDVLQASIVPEQWAAFEQAAAEARCDADTMWQALMDALGVISERPTQRPIDSSDGPPIPSTPPSSEVASVSPVAARLEAQGRPDLALLVSRTQEFLAS